MYDLASYLLHARKRLLNCSECLETLETTKDTLPGDFLENALVDLRDRGGLKWATPNLYFTISAVEETAQRHSSIKQSKIISTKVAVPSMALTKKSHAQIETDKPYENDVTAVQPEGSVLCCNCPLPSKIYTVTKEGENHGRQFYGCEQPRESQCKFFKWVVSINSDISSARKRSSHVSTTSIALQDDKIPAKKARKCGICREEGKE